jgi:hypothetical protein
VSRLLTILLLVPTAALAQSRPTFAANGNTTVTAATTTCTPSTTNLGGVGATDIILLVATSENEAISLSTANNFVEVTNSPQSAGTAATDPGHRLAVYWVRGSSWTSAPVVADSGNHTTCALHRFSGAYETGDPWAVTAGGNDSAANDTSGTIPSGSTGSAENFLIVLIQGSSYNATDTAQCSGWTNSNLANITEQFDSTNTSGLGGGHCMATGEYSSNGDYGSTTVTLAQTTYKGAMSIALKPGTDPAGSGGMMGFWP